MGMWIASHSELLKWMQHIYWDKAESLRADVPDTVLGYAERTTGECCHACTRSLTLCLRHDTFGNPLQSLIVLSFAGLFVYVDPPTGFLTRSVVPYDPERKVLVTSAEVIHERNGYSGGPAPLKVADVFQALRT